MKWNLPGDGMGPIRRHVGSHRAMKWKRRGGEVGTTRRRGGNDPSASGTCPMASGTCPLAGRERPGSDEGQSRTRACLEKCTVLRCASYESHRQGNHRALPRGRTPPHQGAGGAGQHAAGKPAADDSIRTRRLQAPHRPMRQGHRIPPAPAAHRARRGPPPRPA